MIYLDLYYCVRDLQKCRAPRTRDTHHELALGLPHYTCDVTTGTVAVGNEIRTTAF